MVLFEFTDSSVRMFTKHGVLCSYTSYCTVALEKKKKKKKGEKTFTDQTDGGGRTKS